MDRIDLSGFQLPPSAWIIVEAQRRTNFMRLACGTVGTPDLPSGAPLSEFDNPAGIQFRVKVVGASGEDEGKLLAAADGLRASEDGEQTDRTALLPVRPADLGQSLWRLDVHESDTPALLVNKSVVGGWNDFARQPLFRALVFPEVTRQVALWVVNNLADAEDNPESPVTPWISYFKSELGQSISFGDVPADEADRAEWGQSWAEEVAAKFSRKHKFLDSVGAIFGDEQ